MKPPEGGRGHESEFRHRKEGGKNPFDIQEAGRFVPIVWNEVLHVVQKQNDVAGIRRFLEYAVEQGLGFLLALRLSHQFLQIELQKLEVCDFRSGLAQLHGRSQIPYHILLPGSRLSYEEDVMAFLAGQGALNGFHFFLVTDDAGKSKLPPRFRQVNNEPIKGGGICARPVSSQGASHLKIFLQPEPLLFFEILFQTFLPCDKMEQILRLKVCFEKNIFEHRVLPAGCGKEHSVSHIPVLFLCVRHGLFKNLFNVFFVWNLRSFCRNARKKRYGIAQLGNHALFIQQQPKKNKPERRILFQKNET